MIQIYIYIYICIDFWLQRDEYHPVFSFLAGVDVEQQVWIHGGGPEARIKPTGRRRPS